MPISAKLCCAQIHKSHCVCACERERVLDFAEISFTSVEMLARACLGFGEKCGREERRARLGALLERDR